MTWNYIPPGRAEATDRDKVRYLVGDTNECDPLVLDEEIDYALQQFSDVKFAAALVLRALAAKFSREVSMSVGGVGLTNVAARAAGYLTLAKEYDPSGLTAGTVLALPVFGGLSLAEKDSLADDADAVQPFFSRVGDDISGGPTDDATES